MNPETNLEKVSLNLSLGSQKSKTALKKKFISVKEKTIEQNKKRLDGPIKLIRLDKPIDDIIQAQNADPDVHMYGMRVATIREALSSFESFLEKVSKDEPDVYRQIILSASARKATTKNYDRAPLNMRLGNQGESFTSSLGLQYENGETDLSKLQNAKRAWGYTSFIVNEAMFWWLTGQITYGA